MNRETRKKIRNANGSLKQTPNNAKHSMPGEQKLRVSSPAQHQCPGRRSNKGARHGQDYYAGAVEVTLVCFIPSITDMKRSNGRSSCHGSMDFPKAAKFRGLALPDITTLGASSFPLKRCFCDLRDPITKCEEWSVT